MLGEKSDNLLSNRSHCSLSQRACHSNENARRRDAHCIFLCEYAYTCTRTRNLIASGVRCSNDILRKRRRIKNCFVNSCRYILPSFCFQRELFVLQRRSESRESRGADINKSYVCLYPCILVASCGFCRLCGFTAAHKFQNFRTGTIAGQIALNSLPCSVSRDPRQRIGMQTSLSEFCSQDVSNIRGKRGVPERSRDCTS